MKLEIHNKECIDVLKEMKDNSIHSIVTDPPYGIGFMGKEWDTFSPDHIKEKLKKDKRSGTTRIAAQRPSTAAGTYDLSSKAVKKYQDWCYLWALECLRILKPGGHLLASNSSRMYHRMAVAIEDAGFEIRDQIMWVYGSGFPKSLDISKAIDKKGGNPLGFIEFAEAYKKAVESSEYNHNYIDKYLNIKASSCFWVRTDHRGGMPPKHHWVKIKRLLNLGNEFDELYDEAEREVIGRRETKFLARNKENGEKIKGDMLMSEQKGNAIIEDTLPSTPEAKQWDGWGTALKPAHEPIVVARKPLDGTVANNILKWGTGGINIDGCRIETNGEDRSARYNGKPPKGMTAPFQYKNKKNEVWDASKGRFPSNLIHDGSEEVEKIFPDSDGQQGDVKGTEPSHTGESGIYGNYKRAPAHPKREDNGSASRFFYCAKASKTERAYGLEEIKNNHPTVKPLDLMRYLVRLVTPMNGICLDLFMGSGTTGMACKLEGFDFIGIEKEKEYCDIAKGRIETISQVEIDKGELILSEELPEGQKILFETK